MRVAVAGIGLMGSQIAVEHVLAGNHVTALVRHPRSAKLRLADALKVADRAGLCSSTQRQQALSAIVIERDIANLRPPIDLVLESVREDIDVKIAVLAPLARALPDAIIATNTSSIRISDLGGAIGAPNRTVGMHYWNPPLLMPLVEIVAGEQTAQSTVAVAVEVTRGLGKRPIMVAHEVPGFIWNRLQFALLREALWLVEQGVTTAAAVDEVVRDGLARRLRYTGPFATAALGGVETFERIAESLFPHLSTDQAAPTLSRYAHFDADELADVRRSRDKALAHDLHSERAVNQPSID